MSGAEFVAAIGIVASVLQVINSCNAVLERLHQFRDDSAFEHIRLQLPLLIEDLKSLNEQGSKSIPDLTTDAALIRVVEGCRRQVDELTKLLGSMTPAENASKLKKTWIGVRSFGKDAKIRGIMGVLAEYKASLTLHLSSRPFVLSVEGPMTVSAPSYFDIPARRVSHFVGRTDLLRQIRSVIASSTTNPSIIVLTGVGGQGKTQIALEFCHQAGAECRAIFWIDASSEHSALRSFEGIAAKLSKTSQDFPNIQSKITFVKEALRNLSKPWLLVFDNFDRPHSFGGISSFFPSSNGVCKNVILVTSRHTSSGRLGATIKVNGLSEDEGLKLLLRQDSNTGITEETLNQGREIIKKLGYLALAIDQAAAYISIRQLPLSMFAEHYEKRKEVVLKHTPGSLWEYQRPPDDRRSEDVLNLSVLTTWELSFEQIAEDNEEREKLGLFLTCSAFLDATSISEGLFKEGANSLVTLKYLPWLKVFMTHGSWDTFCYQDKVVGLMSLSLVDSIQIKSGDMTFSLHPLIKEWLQLRRRSEMRAWFTLEAIQLTAGFIHARDINVLLLQSRQELLGHIDVGVTNTKQFMRIGNSEAAESTVYATYLRDCATTFATFYGNHDRYKCGDRLFQEVLEWQSNNLGENDIATLQTMNNLGAMYIDMQELEKAETLLRKAIDGKEKTLGVGHPLTLNSVNNLGGVYSSLSMFPEAAYMYSRALAGFSKMHGISHKSVRETRNNLAEVYMKEGDYKLAEEMFEIALSCKESSSMDTNALDLYIQSNLAAVYRVQGRYPDAIKMYQSAIEGRQNLLGPDHSSTLALKIELGDVYHDYGQPELALQWYGGADEVEDRYHRTQQRTLSPMVDPISFSQYNPSPRRFGVTMSNGLEIISTLEQADGSPPSNMRGSGTRPGYRSLPRRSGIHIPQWAQIRELRRQIRPLPDGSY